VSEEHVQTVSQCHPDDFERSRNVFLKKVGFIFTKGWIYFQVNIISTVRVSLPGLLELAIFGGVDA
jgi:hypothetical protein